MSTSSCYFVSPNDPGLTYIASNRLFNFRIEAHGDHIHCDLSIHLVQPGVVLGVGRSLPEIRVRDCGGCRFRFPLSGEQYERTVLIDLIQSEHFQEFAFGPLDDMAGGVDPGRFDLLPD